MKKSLPRRILTASAAMCFSVLAACPAFAANLSGSLDSVNETQITGWAWDQENPSKAVTVELTLAGAGGPGGSEIVSVTADQPRPDLKKALGSSSHSFTYDIDWSTYEGDAITVTAEIVSGDDRLPLDGTLTCQKKKLPAESEKTASNNKKKAAKETRGEEEAKLEASSGGPGFNRADIPSGEAAADIPPTETGEQGDFLGEFTASAYCSCSDCSGQHCLTYSGTVPQPNHTIAADTSVFPIGTKLMIDGVVYTVEDIGGGIKGNRLDIFFATHDEALDFGLQKVKVYSVK